MLNRSTLLAGLVGLAGLASAHSDLQEPRTHLARRKVDGLPAFPDDGQVYFGAWLNGAQGYSDSPAAANARLNLSIPVFQFGQRIPLAPYDYVVGTGWPAFTYLVDLAQTNANYFITVYPEDGLDAVTDGDLVALGTQLAEDAQYGRTVYLRFAPEMQGIWMPYGMQPTAFVALWKRMYTIIKSLAPDTVIVWAPNYSVGFPWGQTLDQVASTEDAALLDTNGNGELDFEDDCFAPYWPGEEYVDAAGNSVYYKGAFYQDINQVQMSGYIGEGLLGRNSYATDQTSNFYDDYCERYDLQCMISEGGAAYHVDVTGGSSLEEVQTGYIQDVYANDTFLAAFPRIKLIMQFEQEKLEVAASGTGNDLRDFRLTNDTDVLSTLKTAFDSLSDRYVWADPVDIEGLDPSSTALPTTNPVLVDTQARTATVAVSSGASETVTWTQTSYSSPYAAALDAFNGVAESASDDAAKAMATSSSAAKSDAEGGGDSDSSSVSKSASALHPLLVGALALVWVC